MPQIRSTDIMRQMFIKICKERTPTIPSKRKEPEEFKEAVQTKRLKERERDEDFDVQMIKETSEVPSSAPSNPSKLKKPQKKNIKFA